MTLRDDVTQPVSLAELVEKWRKVAKECEEYGGDAEDLKSCADELSALLAKHAVAEPPQKPWLYAIQETNAEGVTSWHDGEQCVFGDRESAQDEVDCLNDPFPEGENPFQIVPLYRIPAHAAEQPKENWQPMRGQYVWVEGKLTENQPETFPKKLRVYVHGVGTGIAENVRPVTETEAEQPKLTLTEEQVQACVKWFPSGLAIDYFTTTERLNRLLTSPVAPPPPQDPMLEAMNQYNMEVMGCLICQGQRKNWCPTHGDGSPPPVAPGEQPRDPLDDNYQTWIAAQPPAQERASDILEHMKLFANSPAATLACRQRVKDYADRLEPALRRERT